MGLFSFKKNRNHERYSPSHKIAAIIPARNESTVIAGLIDSLQKQNYPKELFDIFVAPNNCTDATEEVARDAGAKIIRIFGRIKTKGDVLRQSFDYLMRYHHYDAYVVFDADNLVHPEFISRMNDALCAGCEVAQGYRDS
jgi:cellulose synthase/poly-beta-1,6-N-acetylglucosamine synthase-like glycosyltransferase